MIRCDVGHREDDAERLQLVLEHDECRRFWSVDHEIVRCIGSASQMRRALMIVVAALGAQSRGPSRRGWARDRFGPRPAVAEARRVVASGRPPIPRTAAGTGGRQRIAVDDRRAERNQAGHDAAGLRHLLGLLVARQVLVRQMDQPA